ncbi:hypothetical protein R1sor_020699 [Riccia sorocarpa]|uniref:25S rRNA (uridine-N(3))-methyltransferase BMT5-like domain-containing protein n=1 Tax=Riccia sorocarpa TaxID=122646 RepID=A0ABD3GEX5_9MARC
MDLECFPYSSEQYILLVGEGDFTFASAVASILGDSQYISRKYMKAKNALSNLKSRGANIIYNFDATLHMVNPAPGELFHRIIFNFPHAGYFGQCENTRYVISQHQNLIKRFLLNASKMIRPLDGEVHITIQDYNPYVRWKIAELAVACGLRLKESSVFHFSAYPGYVNRRGSGKRAGGTFPVGRGLLKTYRISF